MADNDSKIRDRIHKYAQELISYAQAIGINTINTTFTIDSQHTEESLLDIYEEMLADGDTLEIADIEDINNYTKNMFSQIKQFIDELNNNTKNQNLLNAYISAVCGFVARDWYNTIAQFEPKEFYKKFNRFKTVYRLKYKSFVDLETAINISISRTSFSWIARTHGSTLEDIRHKTYMTYTNGINEATDKQVALDKVYKFLMLIRRIESFFNKNGYQQSKVNIVAPEEYSDLRDTISKGLEFFSFIDADTGVAQFSALKQALFEKLKIKDLHNEYDDTVVYDANNIKKINNTKLGLDETLINKFYLSGAYLYFNNEDNENDIIAKLNDRIYSKYNKISALRANKILEQLINIASISKDSLNLNVSNDTMDNIDEFNKDIFIRARELALNLDSKLPANSAIYNITTLEELNGALKNKNSALFVARDSIMHDKYHEIQDEDEIFTDTITDTSFDNIISVIREKKLNEFFELTDQDNTLDTVLKELNKAVNECNQRIEKKNEKNKELKRKVKPVASIKMPIAQIQKMINALWSLQSQADIIAENAQIWRETNTNKRPPDYIIGYRKLIGEFIVNLHMTFQRGTNEDVRNAIKK